MSHTIVGVTPRNPMWVYEENYRLFLQLLPEAVDAGEAYTLTSDDADGDLEIAVVEIAKYTATLLLTKPFAVDRQWLPDLAMKVRTYDDAGVMEVVGYQGCDRIPPRYRVAAPGKFLRDEKRQVNYLLHDLLRHCLRYDYRMASDSDITRA